MSLQLTPKELVTPSPALFARSMNNGGTEQQSPLAPLGVSPDTALHSMGLEAVGSTFLFYNLFANKTFGNWDKERKGMGRGRKGRRKEGKRERGRKKRDRMEEGNRKRKRERKKRRFYLLSKFQLSTHCQESLSRLMCGVRAPAVVPAVRPLFTLNSSVPHPDPLQAVSCLGEDWLGRMPSMWGGGTELLLNA